MPTSRHLILAGAVAATLLAAACSSSTAGQGSPGTPSGPTGFPSSDSAPAKSSTPSTSTAPTTPITPGTSSASGTPLTRAALSRVVVQAGDLPAGWTGKKTTDTDSSDSQFDTKLATCVGSKALGEDRDLLDLSSDDFSKGMTEISSDVTSYRSQSDVTHQVALLHKPKINFCLNQAFRKQFGAAGSLPRGTRLTGLAIKVGEPPAGSPANLSGVADGTITITTQGRSIKLFLYVAFITGRLLTSNVSAFSYLEPLDTALITSVVKAVAARAANA